MFALLAAKPAGGAALDQVAIASGAALLVTAVLLWLGLGHRSGRVRVLARVGRFSRRVSGLPAWAAIPAGLIVVSLVTALFGMLWDISLHIAQGRDNGPLANPAHYVILAGLFGVFSSGFLSMCLPLQKPSSVSVRLAPGWDAPLGGVLIAAAGAFSLVGFPLDDVWHRLFGQDVTLWGPTHLMLIGGAAMALVGLAVLLAEAGAANAAAGRRGELPWARFMRRISLPGAFLLGLSTFQAEFDFGVPQFRMVFAPMLVMLAAGVALVAARVWLGPGAALGAALFFLVMRGLMALAVGPVLGEPTPHFPLYLVSASAVELVALRVRRPLGVALASGVAIGTVGLAAEWGWSHVWMPLPWPSALAPSGALLGFAMAIAGACVGGWLGARLSADRTPSLRHAGVPAAFAILALVGYGLLPSGSQGVRATVTITRAADTAAARATATPSPARSAATDHAGSPPTAVAPAGTVVVRVDPRSGADDALWFTATAWQGGGLVVDRLQRIGPGVYRTTRPLPLTGDWKTMLRLHPGNALTALPLYLPADEAIPVAGVPARPSVNRAFGPEQKLLQRERKAAASWLWAAAYGVVLAIALAFLVALAWGVHRVSILTRDSSPQFARVSRPAEPVAT
ncbi:hypothetical protein OM076_22250 [Solirubrobacter ginsenosidimutans]|uniref:Uncharacterized protein n=1 Tax=Solirubrobacter ginsenosidimutans TaxID=490573 RepID=A0A9X3MU04_9ACTN|nr:hypothetical protein [Solirubrobacter ginsenosidimutans]MDA0163011.1 hypothetical protein [Solirubrobacter ginsenosidimutans]